MISFLRVWDDWSNLTQLVYVVLQRTLQQPLVRQCACNDDVETIRCWNMNSYSILDVWTYDLRLVATIQWWEWILFCQLISWSIVFAFGSRGPANSTCIIERWMSLQLTFYVRKFHKVHECKLTSIIHKRATWSRCYACGVGEDVLIYEGIIHRRGKLK